MRKSASPEYPRFAAILGDPNVAILARVASLWEIAIEVGLGKLDAGVPLSEIKGLVFAARMRMLPISPEPPTRDPFDRMLLAQCAVEDLRLVTVDRALVDHPLAWRVA